MRLLNTRTLKVVLFTDDNIPQYAILSHTWGEEEVTLQDMEGSSAANKKGYAKVKKCCSLAEANGFEYVWIDTCCIDKTSSAELSEAINSMYYWYQEAEVCYAYLADVTDESQLKSSKWFTRGWTLQELIAPSTVLFFDAEWRYLGIKEYLCGEISECTGIPIGILVGKDDLDSCSVAQRMSWAAKRNTSRIEDRAYCLMGVFGINMPLIYGEREMAFIRLQDEIMKVSDDQSLLAWKSDDDRGGILATSPRAFIHSGDIVQSNLFDVAISPWTVSNRGIHVDLYFLGMGEHGTGLAILNCKESSQVKRPTAIYLRDTSLTMGRFVRIYSHKLESLDIRGFRPSHYPLRRICIHVSRLRKRNRDNRTTEAFPETDNASDLASFVDPKRLFRELNPFGLDEVFYIIQTGSPGRLWLILTRSNIDVNLQDEQNRTPLWYAVDRKYELMVKMLLARSDIKADLRDKNGITPQVHAVLQGHIHMVKTLLQSGKIDPELPDADGQTMLSHAVRKSNEALVQLLLESGVDPFPVHKDHSSPFHQAAYNGHEAIVDLFLERGVDINRPLFLNGVSSYLADAATSGDEVCVKLLLSKGARVNLEGGYKTALMRAAGHGHEAIARLLLERGANIESKDEVGLTPLGHAIQSEQEVTVKLLLEKGANIDSVDASGMTPLVYAIQREHERLVRLLLIEGARVDSKDEQGRTPLMCAVQQNYVAVIPLLLENRSNTELQDTNGYTALMHAARTGHENAVRILLEYNAKTEARNIAGHTALMLAFLYNHREIVLLLQPYPRP